MVFCSVLCCWLSLVFNAVTGCLDAVSKLLGGFIVPIAKVKEVFDLVGYNRSTVSVKRLHTVISAV